MNMEMRKGEQEFYEMGRDFPEVPKQVHATVMDALEALGQEETGTDAKSAISLDDRKREGNRRKLGKRRIACAAALFAAMFGTTVAAAELFHWNEKAVESFGNPSQEVQNEMTASHVAQEQTDSATDQGITVSAVQTLQDENRVYILLNVEMEEELIDCNSGFDIWRVGTTDTDAFWNMGASFAEGTSIEEKSNQGYYEISALKTPGREWDEDGIELELGEFVYYTYEEDTEGFGVSHVVDGTWKLTIPLGEDTQTLTQTYEPNEPILISGYPVTLEEVKISPISAVLSFDLQEMDEMIALVYPDEEDVFVYELQLRGFVYEDGTTVETGGGAAGEYSDQETGRVIKQSALSSVITPEKVTAVLLGSTDTPLEECTRIALK